MRSNVADIIRCYKIMCTRVKRKNYNFIESDLNTHTRRMQFQ